MKVKLFNDDGTRNPEGHAALAQWQAQHYGGVKGGGFSPPAPAASGAPTAGMLQAEKYGLNDQQRHILSTFGGLSGRQIYVPPTVESLQASIPGQISNALTKDKFQQLYSAGYRPDVSGYRGSSIHYGPQIRDLASAQWYHAPETIQQHQPPDDSRTYINGAIKANPRKGSWLTGYSNEYSLIDPNNPNSKLGGYGWKPGEGAQGFSFADALSEVRGPTTAQFQEQGNKFSGIASQLGDYGTQMSDLQSQFGTRGETLSNLQSQFGTRGETISGMQEQIGGFGDQFSKINEGIGGLTSQYGDMQKLLNNFQSQTADFSGGIHDQLGQMEGRIGQLEQQSQTGGGFGGGFGGNNFNPVYSGGSNYTQSPGYGGNYMPLNFGTGLNMPNSGSYPSSAYYGGISPFMFGFY